MYFTQAVGLSNASAASNSALSPLFGGVSVIVAGVLSDKLGPRGRGIILCAGLLLTACALLALSRVPLHTSPLIPVALVALVPLLLLDPYSYLAGVLSGNTMARLTVSYGWGSMFLLLASVALFSTGVAGLSLWFMRDKPELHSA